MTIRPRYDYQIAAGNNNAAGLVNIETIVPSGDVAFYPPEGYASYDPGIFRVRGNGLTTTAGFAATAWVWTRLTRAQFEYLQDTYCASGWSGLVTIRTRIGRRTYANYNAVLTLTKPKDSQMRRPIWYEYRVDFSRMGVL